MANSVVFAQYGANSEENIGLVRKIGEIASGGQWHMVGDTSTANRDARVTLAQGLKISYKGSDPSSSKQFRGCNRLNSERSYVSLASLTPVVESVDEILTRFMGSNVVVLCHQGNTEYAALWYIDRLQGLDITNYKLTPSWQGGIHIEPNDETSVYSRLPFIFNPLSESFRGFRNGGGVVIDAPTKTLTFFNHRETLERISLNDLEG